MALVGAHGIYLTVLRPEGSIFLVLYNLEEVPLVRKTIVCCESPVVVVSETWRVDSAIEFKVHNSLLLGFLG